MLTLYATVQLKLYANEILNRVRRFSLGAFLFLTSIVFWLTGFMLILLALFFYFAGNSGLIFPGVKTALISMGVGLAGSASGIWIMKMKSSPFVSITTDADKKNRGKEFGETFLHETHKLIDNILAGLNNQEGSGGRETKENDTIVTQKCISWLNVLLLFVLGFIAGIMVSGIKRKTEQPDGKQESRAGDKPNDTDRK